MGLPEKNDKQPNHEAMERLAEAIVKQIDYHVAEYDLTYDQVIGGLEIIKLNMYRELIEGADEDENPEEEDDNEDVPE